MPTANDTQFMAGLDEARRRQRHMLPSRLPEVANVEFECFYQPCDLIGGDFYDFIEVGENRIGIVIGDVSGHGIEAAILMGMSKKVIALRLRELGDPRAALTQANDDLRHDLDGRTFVSALVAVLHLGTRALTVVRAGHNPPMLFNPGRSPSIREVEPPGMVLGMAEGEQFAQLLQTETVQLERGDTVLCYTDGLTECESPAGQEFGVERLGQYLSNNADVSMQELLDGMKAQLDQFQGGTDQAQDDLTAIALRLG